MHITSVSSANFGGVNRTSNSFVTQNFQENVSAQKHSAYELPGYNISFGTRILRYDKNPGVMLGSEERAQLDNEIQDIIKYEGSSGTEIEEQMQQLFEKYEGNKAAMKYILVCGLNQEITGNDKKTVHKPYTDYIKAYLHTVSTYFNDSPNKKQEYLRMALFTKNLDGNTLAHAVLEPTSPKSSGMLKTIFDETSNYPNIQVEILEDKITVKRNGNTYMETIGERVGRCRFNQLEDGTVINSVLENLCAHTHKISRQKSIDLLTTNKDMLNRQNKEILEALQSKDCVCSDKEFKKPDTTKNAPIDKPKEKQAAAAKQAGEKSNRVKEIQTLSFFDDDKSKGARRQISQDEVIIPDFLKNYGKRNGSKKKADAGNNNTETTKVDNSPKRTFVDIKLQPGDTEPKQCDRELKVGDFFNPNKKGSAIQAIIGAEAENLEQTDALEDTKRADMNTEIEDFNQHVAQKIDPFIIWEATACDG